MVSLPPRLRHRIQTPLPHQTPTSSGASEMMTSACLSMRMASPASSPGRRYVCDFNTWVASSESSVGSICVVKHSHSRSLPVFSQSHTKTYAIQDDKQKIKAREQRVGKADVVGRVLERVVLAIDRVGSCQDRAAGIQRGVDARLGNGHSL